MKPSAADPPSPRAEIDAWRAARQSRAHMPAHLWEAAVTLVGPLPVTRVARELGLSRGRLSARVAAGLHRHLRERPDPPPSSR